MPENGSHDVSELLPRAEALGRAARAQYGPDLDKRTLLELLDDRRYVFHPTHFVFDAEPLQKGEFGWVQRLGEAPEEGYILYIHPHFRDHEDLPMLIAYQMVVPNWDGVADDEVALRFAGALFDRDPEAIYRRVCELADAIPDPERN